MNNKKTKILFIPIFLFLTSCFYDNQIYFDIENQSIETCNKRVISKLYIKRADYRESFRFTKIKDKEGVNVFSINKIDLNYSIELNGLITNKDAFKLRSNTEYNIENASNGDAASDILSIKTDNNGKVKWASKTTCK